MELKNGHVVSWLCDWSAVYAFAPAHARAEYNMRKYANKVDVSDWERFLSQTRTFEA